MEISNACHHQTMTNSQLEQVLAAISYNNHDPHGQHHQQQQAEKKPAAARPHPDQALKCPRCDSANTKFCYYNNYSLSQPRYFCKACRRYWTHGGSLRNVPVGGGCRKNRRSKKPQPLTSSSATATATNPNPNYPTGLLDILNGYTDDKINAYYADQTAAGIAPTSEGYWIDNATGIASYWNGLVNSSL